MEDKAKLIIPSAMDDMKRTENDIILNKMYAENDLIRLNIVVNNSVENVFKSIVDLEKYIKVFNPAYEVIKYKGEPGEIGFTVKGTRPRSIRGKRMKFEDFLSIQSMKAPNFVQLSMQKEIRKNCKTSESSMHSFNLVDRLDGTVLVQISMTAAFDDFYYMLGFVSICVPCFTLATLCLITAHDEEIRKEEENTINYNRNYMNNAKYENNPN